MAYWMLHRGWTIFGDKAKEAMTTMTKMNLQMKPSKVLSSGSIFSYLFISHARRVVNAIITKTASSSKLAKISSRNSAKLYK